MDKLNWNRNELNILDHDVNIVFLTSLRTVKELGAT